MLRLILISAFLCLICFGCIGKFKSEKFYAQGLQDMVRRDYNEAINNFNRSLHEDSSNDKSYFQKGIACDKLQDYSGAWLNFKLAIKLKPNNELYQMKLLDAEKKFNEQTKQQSFEYNIDEIIKEYGFLNNE